METLRFQTLWLEVLLCGQYLQYVQTDRLHTLRFSLAGVGTHEFWIMNRTFPALYAVDQSVIRDKA